MSPTAVDSGSCNSKNTRQKFLKKLFASRDIDDTSTINDELSSIESASMFEESATVKSSHITQTSRRRLIERLMEKDDDLSSIALSHLSMN